MKIGKLSDYDKHNVAIITEYLRRKGCAHDEEDVFRFMLKTTAYKVIDTNMEEGYYDQKYNQRIKDHEKTNGK